MTGRRSSCWSRACYWYVGALCARSHQVDDGQNPLKFSQSFTLLPENGSFYVFNDIFRYVARPWY